MKAISNCDKSKELITLAVIKKHGILDEIDLADLEFFDRGRSVYYRRSDVLTLTILKCEKILKQKKLYLYEQVATN